MSCRFPVMHGRTRIAGLLRDVAALSAKLRKPLSARLFLVPGKKAGEIARFNDPLLTDSVMMKIGLIGGVNNRDDPDRTQCHRSGRCHARWRC